MTLIATGLPRWGNNIRFHFHFPFGFPSSLLDFSFISQGKREKDFKTEEIEKTQVEEKGVGWGATGQEGNPVGGITE